MNIPVPGPLFSVINNRLMRETSTALVEVCPSEAARMLNAFAIALSKIAAGGALSPEDFSEQAIALKALGELGRVI